MECICARAVFELADISVGSRECGAGFGEWCVFARLAIPERSSLCRPITGTKIPLKANQSVAIQCELTRNNTTLLFIAWYKVISRR